jgi:hypothetical protein
MLSAVSSNAGIDMPDDSQLSLSPRGLFRGFIATLPRLLIRDDALRGHRGTSRELHCNWGGYDAEKPGRSGTQFSRN